VGAERLLFGSGLPAASPGPAIAALQYAFVADEQRAMIAGENLSRLLEEVGS
jgi:predicted TIM-barrel fold metal-dependent hydrolase